MTSAARVTEHWKRHSAIPSHSTYLSHLPRHWETTALRFGRSIAKYLDQPKIRSLLGVDPTVSQNFSSCSNEVGMAFVVAGDMMQASYEYVAGLLERDVRVLIYVGAYDWICNWISNGRWTLALDWSGKTRFASQELREWEVDGAVAGKTRSAKGLTFATVDGAGHMVLNFEGLIRRSADIFLLGSL